MLVPPKDQGVLRTADKAVPETDTAADPVIEHGRAQTAAALMGTSDAPVPSTVQPAHDVDPATSDSAIHFENGSAVAETSTDAAQPPLPPQKATQHKPKAHVAKRRKLRHHDSSLEASFDSLQRSLASIFD
jgi:hypothetical protein